MFNGQSEQVATSAKMQAVDPSLVAFSDVEDETRGISSTQKLGEVTKICKDVCIQAESLGTFVCMICVTFDNKSLVLQKGWLIQSWMHEGWRLGVNGRRER